MTEDVNSQVLNHTKFRICESGMITSVLLNHRVVLDIELDILKVPFTI